ncbi:MFS transporter [Paenibacillus albidus]|uniref:MFS transporter n=1 Tax=Paenibacillus albidus TaxID=2041023 RepID=UPI001BE8D3F6|nr:MFS transporter [Paenibacillus albidus]MBT2293659.1 MFS transporter [Paenibacillus albidus]
MKVSYQKYSLHVYNYFFYIAYASYLPFISYWFAEEGLSTQQIGLIFSIGPLVGFLVQPLWGMLIDYYGLAKWLLIISTGITPWVVVAYRFAGDRFWLYIVISIVLAVFSSATLPVIDAITVRHAKKNSLSYGAIRVVGSISFGLAVAVFGQMYDHFGVSTVFVVYIATMSLVCLLTFSIQRDRKRPVRPGGAGKKTPQRGMTTGMVSLLKEPKFVWFLIPVFLAAIGPQMNNAFYSVYISHFGGEASGKIGLLYTAASLTEIPVFLFSGYLIRKFGYVKILTAVSLAGALRWYVLSLEPSFEVLMANQMLSGLTYALFLSAGINYAYDNSSDLAKATAHSLFVVVYTNIAGIIASNIGGWVIERGGYSLLFQGAAVMSLLGAAGFASLGRVKNNKRRLKV